MTTIQSPELLSKLQLFPSKDSRLGDLKS
ncbi:hypothetical protein HU200_032768 [Digitaria exilis]|uniref:Uncharacterized protein n=1 Tax=Digitaria exilis TaxID=1010633 RepID=A0A835BK22_9POAL|nr:hypothetical protein HU200_032768 [Digitaria exilis]